MPPAREGWVSTAARVEGRVWVSRAFGLVLAADFDSALTSSYLTGNLRTERRAVQTITASTRRAGKTPD